MIAFAEIDAAVADAATVTLALLMIAAQAFDIWTTDRNLSAGGREWNYLGRMALRNFGGVWPIKVFLLIPIGIGFWWSQAGGNLALALCIGLGLLASWINIRRGKAS